MAHIQWRVVYSVGGTWDFSVGTLSFCGSNMHGFLCGDINSSDGRQVSVFVVCDGVVRSFVVAEVVWSSDLAFRMDGVLQLFPH